jgi:hypothetical protein
MSNLELFLLGLVVTFLTAAALAPLIWAAIQDGRYNDEQQQLYREQALRAQPAAAAEPAAVSHVR